ncbi:MAG TPA: DUF1304 domain-containing protein [Terrimesophilobacter sp.]|nr:DUF1304 domain-containing protein [Terrimesophilobacter sp.]
MAILITIAATVSAAVHVLFFYWESVVWKRPTTWRRFGVTTQEHADASAAFAYNQGFYNLFLAIGALLGSILFGVGFRDAGFALGLFSVVSMLAAAVVLMTSGRGRVPAALIQGTAPLITVVLYLVSLTTGV